MEWTVLIAVKALPAAKSRLLPASSDAAAHGRLVDAIRADSVAAAQAAAGVARVVLVVDRADYAPVPDTVRVVVQRSAGLNGALRDGAAAAAARWPDDGVAALVGDLPALRPDDLAAALAAAAAVPHGFVADAAGTGTTLLTARPGVTLQPGFGPGSAARHGTHAAPLPAAAGLRHDVDTAADLDAAVALGVGPCTADVLAGQLAPRRPCGSGAVHPGRA